MWSRLGAEDRSRLWSEGSPRGAGLAAFFFATFRSHPRPIWRRPGAPRRLEGVDPLLRLAPTVPAKVSRRLLPFLFLLYIVCFLDRVNVGFAALQMNRELGFSPAMYGLGAGIFFLGYVLCEIPSNLILARVGARIWIARIMVTWGVIACAMMFIRGPVS